LIEELRLIVFKKTASFRKERALIHLSHALVARVQRVSQTIFNVCSINILIMKSNIDIRVAIKHGYLCFISILRRQDRLYLSNMLHLFV